MNALNVAIRAKLTGDSGVNNAASGGIYQGVAPRSVSGTPVGYPRVYFQRLRNVPLYTFRLSVANNFVYQIKALAIDTNTEGAVAAATLDEAIQALLTDPALTVTGKTCLYCRFLQSIPDMDEWDEAISGNIYHRGGLYEVWLA